MGSWVRSRRLSLRVPAGADDHPLGTVDPADAEAGGDHLGQRSEVDHVLGQVRTQVERLRELSPLWDMYKEGIDLKSVQWAAH